MSCQTSLPLSIKIPFLLLFLLMMLWLQENEAKPTHKKYHHKKHSKVCGLTQVGDVCSPGSRKYKKCCVRGLSCLSKPKYTVLYKKGKKYKRVQLIYTCQKPVLDEDETIEVKRINVI